LKDVIRDRGHVEPRRPYAHSHESKRITSASRSTTPTSLLSPQTRL
jgi:hypothetical protein